MFELALSSLVNHAGFAGFLVAFFQVKVSTSIRDFYCWLQTGKGNCVLQHFPMVCNAVEGW